MAVILANANAQTPTEKGPHFDIEDFNAKFDTAQWLADYDEVAWKTSDLVMAADKAEVAKLGKEWFCFQDDKKIWHAVYGKFDKAHYELVLQYIVDAAGKISRSVENLDQAYLDSHARALNTAVTQLHSKIPPDSPLFNQYIRRNTDKTFEVWMFPRSNPTA